MKSKYLIKQLLTLIIFFFVCGNSIFGVSFPYTGGSATSSFSASYQWSVESAPGWVSVSPGSGFGNSTVTISCSANSSTSSRSGTIVISRGGQSAVNISVSQSGVPVYRVTASAGTGGFISPDYQDVTSGGSCSFYVSAAPGYHISGYSGGSLSGSTLTVSNVTSNRSVSVSFALNTYTVTASAGSGGTISPSSQTVSHGGSCSFSVSANNGYYASGCSGGSLSGNTVTVSNVTSNRSVSVSFSLISYTVTASAGSGGSISPTSQNVSYGGSCTFSVSPNTGYYASGCSGGSLSGNTVTVGNVTSNRSVSVTFSLKSYAISASAGSGGSISPSGDVSVTHGGSQTFSITPNTADGYEIQNVSVDGGSSQGPISSYTFSNVTSTHMIQASFRLKTYTVTAGAGSGGSISPSSQTVSHGGSASFTVTPNAGYTISGCTGGTLSGNTVTVSNVTSTRSVSVTFALRTFTFQAEAGEGGSIDPSGNVTVTYGTNQTFDIIPNTGYEVGTVYIDGGGNQGALSSYTFHNVTASHLIQAYFIPKTYTVTASAGQGGSISPASQTVTHGGSVSFTVNPNTGYTISGCTGGTLSGNTVIVSNVTSNRSVSVSFALQSFTFQAEAGAGGSIDPSGNVPVTYGTNQTFDIIPNTGYEIGAVYIDGGGNQGAISSYTFYNVTSSHLIQASFNLKSYMLHASVDGFGGTISPSGNISVNHGDDRTFSINKNTNYTIADVKVDGVSQGPISSYTFDDVTDDHTIVASFNPYPSINASAGIGGSITPSGNVYVAPDSTITFTIQADSGYVIQDVNVDGQNRGPLTSYTFNSVQTGHLIEAYFIQTYIVNVTAGPGGTVNPTTQTVRRGSTAMVSVQSDTGYRALEPVGGGTLVGDSVYVYGVVKNENIYVPFGQITPKITASATSGGTIDPEGDVYVGYGDDKTFSITPNTLYDYYTSHIIVDEDTLVTDTTSYTFYDVTEDHSIAAVFEPYITIQVNQQPGGIITPGEYQRLKKGDDITFFIKADEGYKISSLNISGQLDTTNCIGRDSASYTFSNLQSHQLIGPRFEKKKYSVTVSAYPDSAGEAYGEDYVNYGDTVKVYAIPSQDFGFTNWTVNDSLVSTDSVYLFVCTKNTHLVANFSNSKAVVLVPSRIFVSGEAGNRLIKVYSGSLWMVTTNDASWLSLSPTSGRLDGNIMLSFEENTGIKRTGIVIVTSKYISDTLTITQYSEGTRWVESDGALHNPNSGNVGIGTMNPDEKLTVKGAVLAKEIIIEADVVPDFVFEEDYKMLTLQEIESYIKNHKHLPGIPNAFEVQNKGIILGNSQMSLLQKIEEISLYLLAAKKELENIARDVEEYKLKTNKNDTRKFDNK